MAQIQIPFNRAYATGHEFAYIEEAIANLHISGNGPFTARCTAWLEDRTGTRKALLTTSGSSALELAAMLVGLNPGDEVIMPSFTYVSTANCVVREGATPVFVDIRPDTLNLDEQAIEPAITERTRAILPVHYAGIGCAMDQITETAQRHGLSVIEDAAQGLMASYRGRALGGIGDLGCLSFHETKNVTCGEGGAVLVNDPGLVEKAEVMQEKGTDRNKFFRGEVDRYTWVDRGSSFLPSEINAAFLWAQLEHSEQIMRRRHEIWSEYHEAFEEYEKSGRLRRPVTPPECRHNAHMYYLLLEDRDDRDALIDDLAQRGVMAVFHYVPLHSSPAGERYGRAAGPLPVTDRLNERLVRLPLWPRLTDDDVRQVIDGVKASL